jgi:hypothetical protein
MTKHLAEPLSVVPMAAMDAMGSRWRRRRHEVVPVLRTTAHQGNVDVEHEFGNPASDGLPNYPFPLRLVEDLPITPHIHGILRRRDYLLSSHGKVKRLDVDHS